MTIEEVLREARGLTRVEMVYVASILFREAKEGELEDISDEELQELDCLTERAKSDPAFALDIDDALERIEAIFAR